MTAHAMAGDEQKSHDAGMNDHVTKPIDPEKLFATLRRWIKPGPVAAIEQAPGANDASVGAEPPASSADDPPPSLPGFDLPAGLARLMGNKSLYRKLLLDFGAEYVTVVDKIRESVAADDYDQIHSLVHNLKGLAGNLEATELQAAAVNMEKLVKGRTAETASEEELNRMSKQLETALQQALDAVQTLTPGTGERAFEPAADELSFASPELAQKFADRIRAAADMGDVIEIKSAAEEMIADSAAATPFGEKLVRLADDFDLEGVKALVGELADS